MVRCGERVVAGRFLRRTPQDKRRVHRHRGKAVDRDPQWPARCIAGHHGHTRGKQPQRVAHFKLGFWGRDEAVGHVGLARFGDSSLTRRDGKPDLSTKSKMARVISTLPSPVWPVGYSAGAKPEIK